MPYITVYQTRNEHQITFEEIISGEYKAPLVYSNCESNTRTCYVPQVNEKFLRNYNIDRMIGVLESFNTRYSHLFNVDRRSLYTTFYIPKKSGGLRKINAPNDSLMVALRDLKAILENDMFALHHTAAFAYVRGRSPVDAIKKHQHNESWWFLKTDFSDFFGNTTQQFLMHMLSMIFPFCEIVNTKRGSDALSRALNLCFLDGGLPQGTPISPMLTNLMMIPIDHRLFNCLRDYNKQTFVYTRYADDIIISSRRDFNHEDLVKFISRTLSEFKAPFTIKPEKTTYGSRAGKNRHLGVLLNKDNEITVGHKNKKYFRAMINNYIMDKKNGISWDLHDVQVLYGTMEYYRMIEREYINEVIRFNNDRYGIDVVKMMLKDMSV